MLAWTTDIPPEAGPEEVEASTDVVVTERFLADSLALGSDFRRDTATTDEAEAGEGE